MSDTVTPDDAAAGAAVKRVSIMAGWDKSAGGKKWSKSIAFGSADEASNLARRLIKLAYKYETALSLSCDGPSLGVALDADGRRFAGKGSKIARVLQTVSSGG